MKTTVEISDGLFAEAKRAAQAKGVSLRELIEQGLRWAVDSSKKPGRKFKLKDGSVGGKSLVQPRSWEEIRSLIYEEQGG